MKKLLTILLLLPALAFGSPAVICPDPDPEILVDPICNVSVGSLQYGNVEVGSTSDLSFTITNIGAGTLAGTVSKTQGPYYDITVGESSYSLTNGQSHNVTVRYEPLTVGAPHVAIIETGNDLCGDIVCNGAGINPPQPQCSVSPSSLSLSFGNVTEGNTDDRVITVQNVGGSTLSGTISISGDSEFSLVGTAAYSLTSGQSHNITVRFSPLSSPIGGFSATVETGNALCGDVSCTGLGIGAGSSTLFTGSDLQYLGAFQFKRSAPSGGGDSLTLSFGGTRGLTFRPTQASDPSPSDGFPGTLFMNMYDAEHPDTGDNGSGKVCEQSIPVPVVSQDIGSLNNRSGVLNITTAVQNGANITGGLYNSNNWSIRRWGGLLYLEGKGNWTSPKLLWSFYDGYNVDNQDRITHGWSEIDFTDPSAGSSTIDAQYRWHPGAIDDGNRNHPYHYLKSSGFMFEIPQSIANTHFDGKSVAACVASREAGTQGSSSGPSIIAYAPWLDAGVARPGDTAPPDSSQLDALALLYYIRDEGAVVNCAGLPSESITGYNLSDSWTGGAWMEHGNKTAVLFAGSRCLYVSHYYDGCDGCPPGFCWNEAHTACTSTACCDGCDEDAGACGESKGYACGNEGDSSPAYKIYFALYDPQNFYDVAAGSLQPNEPQPYEFIDLSAYMWPGCQVGTYGVAYDRDNGYIYLSQSGVDITQSGQEQNIIAVCHVFKFGTNEAIGGGTALPGHIE